MKKSVLVGLFASLLLSVSAQAADKLKMGVVVKIGGIPRFNAMEAGIKARAPNAVSMHGWSGRRRRIRRCRCAPSKI